MKQPRDLSSKKYQIAGIALLIVAGLGFSFYPAKAAGTFQLSNFNSSVYGIVNEPVTITINFFYSGDNVPGVSIVGNPAVINEMALGSISYGENGYDSVTWRGTPTQAGNYPMTLTLTDNYGAFLTQQFNFDAFNEEITITTTTLPAGIVGSNYSAAINVNWWGEGTPGISFMGTLPKGISPVGSVATLNTGYLNGGSETMSLSGIPSGAGQFPITLNATLGTSSASEALMLNINSSSSQTASVSSSAIPPTIPIVPSEPTSTTLTNTVVNSPVKNPSSKISTPKPAVITPPSAAASSEITSSLSTDNAAPASSTPLKTSTSGSDSQPPIEQGFFARIGGALDNLISSLFHLF